MKRLWSLGPAAGLVIGIFYYLLSHQGDLKAFLRFRPVYILFMLMAGTGHFMVSGCFNRVILELCSIRVKIQELCALAAMTTIGNYLLPLRGGMGLRALYLKEKYHFPYSRFASGTAGIFLVFFLVNSLLGLFSLLFLYAYRGFCAPALVLLFALVFSLVLAPFLLPVRKIHRRLEAASGRLSSLPSAVQGNSSTPLAGRLLKFLSRSLEGWLQLKKSPRSVPQLAVLTLVNSALNMILLYFGFLSASITLDIADLVMIASLLSVSGLVNIVPGGLGIQEAAIVFPSHALGISVTQSLMASIFVRFVNLTLALALIPFFRKYLGSVHRPAVQEN